MLETGRAQSSSDRHVTKAQYDGWKAELSNWGRWGPDDEIGALNLITPAKRKQEFMLTVSPLAVPGGAEGVERGEADLSRKPRTQRSEGSSSIRSIAIASTATTARPQSHRPEANVRELRAPASPRHPSPIPRRLTRLERAAVG